jgi:hypothetical protein
MLLFDGEVDGKTLQVAVVIRDGSQGLIQELTVLMRRFRLCADSTKRR